MKNLLHKIIVFIQKSFELVEAKNRFNEQAILITLSTLHILIENCPNAILEEVRPIAHLLINLNCLESTKIKINLAHCWNSLIKANKEILFELSENLIIYFLDNFKIDSYELNFASAEFFSFVIDEEENILSNDKIKSFLENKLYE